MHFCGKTVAVVFAMIGIICITEGWAEAPPTATFKEYKISFSACILGGKAENYILFINSSHFPLVLYLNYIAFSMYIVHWFSIV